MKKRILSSISLTTIGVAAIVAPTLIIQNTKNNSSNTILSNQNLKQSILNYDFYTNANNSLNFGLDENNSFISLGKNNTSYAMGQNDNILFQTYNGLKMWKPLTNEFVDIDTLSLYDNNAIIQMLYSTENNVFVVLRQKDDTIELSTINNDGEKVNSYVFSAEEINEGNTTSYALINYGSNILVVSQSAVSMDNRKILSFTLDGAGQITKNEFSITTSDLTHEGDSNNVLNGAAYSSGSNTYLALLQVDETNSTLYLNVYKNDGTSWTSLGNQNLGTVSGLNFENFSNFSLPIVYMNSIDGQITINTIYDSAGNNSSWMINSFTIDQGNNTLSSGNSADDTNLNSNSINIDFDSLYVHGDTVYGYAKTYKSGSTNLNNVVMSLKIKINKGEFSKTIFEWTDGDNATNVNSPYNLMIYNFMETLGSGDATFVLPSSSNENILYLFANDSANIQIINTSTNENKGSYAYETSNVSDIDLSKIDDTFANKIASNDEATSNAIKELITNSLRSSNNGYKFINQYRQDTSVDTLSVTKYNAIEGSATIEATFTNCYDANATTSSNKTFTFNLTGFKKVTQTSWTNNNTLTFTSQSGTIPSASNWVLSDNTNAQVKDFILANINTLLNGYSTELFSSDDFTITNVKPNNIDGIVTLTLSLNKYIDEDGQIKNSSLDPNQEIAIKGFTVSNGSTNLSKTNISIDGVSNIKVENWKDASDKIKQAIIQQGIVSNLFNPNITVDDIELSLYSTNERNGSIKLSITILNSKAQVNGEQVSSATSLTPDGKYTISDQQLTVTGFEKNFSEWAFWTLIGLGVFLIILVISLIFVINKSR